MNNGWIVSIATGLLVYVGLAIFLGVVDYILPIMSDDSIIMVCVIFGLSAAVVSKIRDYA